MCLLCAEISKGSLTSTELARAYHEIEIAPDHWAELIDMLNSSDKSDEVIEELNKIYKNERKR